MACTAARAMVLSGAALVCGALSAAPARAAAADPPSGGSFVARPADEFADSIGVCTHFGYTDTPYHQRAAEVREKLDKLGIRYIRDGVDTSNWKNAHRIVRDLYDTHGIKVLQLVGPRLAGKWPQPLDLNPATTDAVLEALKERYGDANLAIEGPNEYDISCGPGEEKWAENLRAYQEMLYARVKADPVLRSRLVIAPSICFGHEKEIGDISAVVDRGCMHSYPGGRQPTNHLAENIKNARLACGPKVIWATETGYHNALNQPRNWGHPGVPEEIEAKYLPRLYAEYFLRGVERSFSYELLDEFPNAALDHMEKHFGLLRHDLSEKPVFHALENLIALLADPGEPFQPGKLTYRLEGELAAVHRCLLQKRDGAFYLLLWQEIPSWDTQTRKAVPAPECRAKLTLGTRFARAAVFMPASRREPLAVRQNAGALELRVPDELLVIELVPRKEEARPAGGPRPARQPMPRRQQAEAGQPEEGDAAQLEAASIYKKAESLFVEGRLREATDLFRKLVREHPDWEYARKAEEYLDVMR